VNNNTRICPPRIGKRGSGWRTDLLKASIKALIASRLVSFPTVVRLDHNM